MDFIKSYILKEYIFNGKAQRIEKWQYPLKSLREFVINAIVHRDYREEHSQFQIFPDKIVLWNSGKLPYDLTIEDIKKGNQKSHPRNKLIAEIFRDAGFIERYGSGIKRAIMELKMNNLAEPDIKEISGGLEVTIYSSKTALKTTPKTALKTTPKTSYQITNLERKILIKINENSKITRKELAKELNISLNTIKEYIAKMKKKNLLTRIGSSRNGYWKVEVELDD
ncbi:ATP-binding protein [Marinitoga lauensis]|uniref:ATP-binding protein n=1 Tax=Marinitoga lauensis TaxID=2201189 RepID=UPI0023EA5FBA|nr:ATP-binding protein [Marinitoga lauensis]